MAREWIVDQELGELRRELLAMNARLAETMRRARYRRASIERVRALHKRESEPLYKGVEARPFMIREECAHCHTAWPCQTIQALNGKGKR